jgi:hypothetical protein
MKQEIKFGTSIVGGVVITMLTGLVSSTSKGLVGAVWYGYPLNWVNKLITYPTAWRIQLGGLVVDLVFWFVVVLIALMVVERLKGK